MPIALRYAARSNVGLGSKARNEDSAYAGPELLVLCDGMGGHAAGDVASSLVVGELVHLDGESHGADDALDILEAALEEADDRLAEVMDAYPDSDGMGTTCIAMLRAGSKLAVANIGDSRAYLVRNGRITQITRDHSFVQKLLDEGRITKDEARHHPQRSLVTKVMTGRPEDTPDLSLRELALGDRILICSDGLTDYVSEDTVHDILRETDRTAGQVADDLIRTALRASTRDNVTVVVADAVTAGEGTTKPQVVGAASERRGTRMISEMSAAEKAAALSREVNTPDTPADPVLAEEQSGPVVRALRGLGVGLALVAVLVAAVWGGWQWSQAQYFVGADDGEVTIFRGLSQDVGPISLSTPEAGTGIRVDDLPVYYRQQVAGTLSANDRADADRIVEDLRQMSRGRCVPTVLLPDGTTSTALPADAVATTADSLAEARADQEGATATGAPDDIADATATDDPGESGSPLDTLLREALARSAGTGQDAGADGIPSSAEPTPASPEAPRVTVIWPEGCP